MTSQVQAQAPIENTTEKMKFSIKDFFSKCDQIRRKLKKSLMKNLLKKPLMKNLVFCAVKQSHNEALPDNKKKRNLSSINSYWKVSVEMGSTMFLCFFTVRCICINELVLKWRI